MNSPVIQFSSGQVWLIIPDKAAFNNLAILSIIGLKFDRVVVSADIKQWLESLPNGNWKQIQKQMEPGAHVEYVGFGYKSKINR